MALGVCLRGWLAPFALAGPGSPRMPHHLFRSGRSGRCKRGESPPTRTEATAAMRRPHSLKRFYISKSVPDVVSERLGDLQGSIPRESDLPRQQRITRGESPAFCAPNVQPSLLIHNALAHAMMNDSVLTSQNTFALPSPTEPRHWDGREPGVV
jgi:hypothetical protein